jgi:predicted RND superfamily exporter protein
MGLIMSVGVSVANAILMVTNAENLRLEIGDTRKAVVLAANSRIRPILMTSIAMIAGMVPMASGIGEGGDQIAPLGQAVIGGLIASTLAALLILPCVFTQFQTKASVQSVSLDPEDPESKFYNQLTLLRSPVHMKPLLRLVWPVVAAAGMAACSSSSPVKRKKPLPKNLKHKRLP